MALEPVDNAAADTNVGVILHVGSGFGCVAGIEHVAVFVCVVCTTDNLYFVTGSVARALEVVTVTFLGVVVVVGLKVTEALVIVEGVRVTVFVVVVVEETSKSTRVNNTPYDEQQIKHTNERSDRRRHGHCQNQSPIIPSLKP